MSTFSPVVWLADIDTESEKIGTHTKRLAQLEQAAFPMLPSFVITADAYATFLRENKLDHKISQLLSTISFELPDSLMQAEYHIKQLFYEAEISENIINNLADFCQALDTDEVTLSLFEIGPHGKKHSTKQARTLEELIDTVIDMWSEMFSGKALWHRQQRKIHHIQAGAEILVQKKVKADKAGKILTIDPHTHAKDKLVVIINHPHAGDTYTLSKRNLTIIDRELKHITNLDKLSHDDLLTLGQVAKEAEQFFYFPQEITWEIEGDIGYIVEVKPFGELPIPRPEKKKRVPIARGKGITKNIGTGVVTILHSQKTLPVLTSHTVLITSELTPNLVKKLKRIQGVVIENHPQAETTILLRRHGIPTICNVLEATKHFRNGHLITINGATGEIYQGGFL